MSEDQTAYTTQKTTPKRKSYPKKEDKVDSLRAALWALDIQPRGRVIYNEHGAAEKYEQLTEEELLDELKSGRALKSFRNYGKKKHAALTYFVNMKREDANAAFLDSKEGVK